MSYKKSIISGAKWQGLSVFLSTLCQLISIMVLGRYLNPEDFGAYASCSVLIGFSNTFIEASLGPALIHYQNVEEREKSSVFYLSILSGSLLVLIVYMLAPFYGSLFDSDTVVRLTRYLSLTFLVSALAVVPNALLAKQLKFQLLAKLQLLRSLCSVVIAVAAAAVGMGVWALVCASLGSTLIYSILLWGVCPVRFHRFLGFRAMLPYIRYGAHLISARFFNQVAQSADYFVIGKVLGVETLGYYERSYKMMQMPSTMLGNVLARIGFPIMSKLQDNAEELRKGFFGAVRIGYTVQIPICVIIIILAPEMVRVVLGPGWESVVLPLQILVVTIPLRILARLGDSLCRAKGEVAAMAKRKMGFALLVVVGSWIGSTWGIVGVAFGVAMAVCFNYLAVLALCYRVLVVKSSIVGQVKMMQQGLLIGSFVLLLFGVCTYLMRAADWSSILVLVVNGGIVVLCGVVAIWRFNLIQRLKI